MPPDVIRCVRGRAPSQQKQKESGIEPATTPVGTLPGAENGAARVNPKMNSHIDQERRSGQTTEQRQSGFGETMSCRD